jgi:hypothetical protein
MKDLTPLHSLVMPAEAGIKRLLIERKILDPSQKHAGMTRKWDSSNGDPIESPFVKYLIV